MNKLITLERHRMSDAKYRKSEKGKVNKQKYLQINKIRLNKKRKQWQDTHKERRKKISTKYYNSHKKECLERTKNWQKSHPEKLLLSQKKLILKYKENFDLTEWQYKFAIQAWSKSIRKLTNNICQICDEPAVHAHHIFPKSTHPELSLNLNNGIALCEIHHREIHNLNKRWSN